MQTIQYAEPGSPRKLNPAVARDLEAIVLKCLEKDKVRRYATAGELAADLGRFMRSEPVTARRSSPWELTVKWMRRRPAIAALANAKEAREQAKKAMIARTEATQQEKNAFMAREEANRQRDVARRTTYVARMSLAQREWEDAHVPRVLDLLAGERPREGQIDLR
jgi:hypothetical protein